MSVTEVMESYNGLESIKEERDTPYVGSGSSSTRFIEDIRLVLLKQALNEQGYELVINDSPANIRLILETAGNQMGSVQFIKRSDGSLRKMSYRLHVKNPTFANKPKGKKKVDDVSHNQMTVFDCNKPVRNEHGVIIGRGAWRTIPLENVTRIVAGGKKYLILPS